MVFGQRGCILSPYQGQNGNPGLVTINVDTVVFRVQCQYADKNFDDAYEGYVTALVIAEVQ